MSKQYTVDHFEKAMSLETSFTGQGFVISERNVVCRVMKISLQAAAFAPPMRPNPPQREWIWPVLLDTTGIKVYSSSRHELAKMHRINILRMSLARPPRAIDKKHNLWGI